MSRSILTMIMLAAAGISLAGCAATNDPFNRPGTWRESPSGGAPMYDLRAEVANPHDLIRGHGPKPHGLYGGVLAQQGINKVGSNIGSGFGNGAMGGGTNGYGGTTGGVGGAMGGSMGGIGGAMSGGL